jgi:hypothetical protein
MLDLNTIILIPFCKKGKSSNTYDMIIGRDILTELGMILNIQDIIVSWDTDILPLRVKRNLETLKLLTEVHLTANEPYLLEDEYPQSTKILDA